MSIKIVDEETAEACDFVVCMRKEDAADSPFTDNMEGECVNCHHAVVFRPHSPKKPVRVCLQCLAEVSARFNSTKH